ncbi:MAG TPA: T9SS type B sorting domain-containing protein [Saprospiraceae bacterium]|nr:T9SS type B sorting domain-containing protein [Saprospiraceae bacterium]
MRMHNLRNWLGAVLLGLLPVLSYAQHEDCRTAFIICSDSSFSFTPTGPGIDDFANPNNDEGCLFRGETISSWFYFELREDMPLDSNQLGFLIRDTLPNYLVDYDFAIYGPNLTCDSLGSPYRCSFARLPNNGNLGPGSIVSTGFMSTAQDTVEDFNNADGFLKPMEVKPGDGFFLVIDLFVSAFDGSDLESFDSTLVQEFSFIWGGSAAPWLNCIVNPNCDQVTVDLGMDQELCAGESLQLNTQVTNTAGRESYIWSEANGLTTFLSDPNIPNPTLEIPPGFSGTLEYTVLVKEGACEHTDQITITVRSGGVPNITGDNLVCIGDSSDLMAEAGFETYLWSTGDTVPNIRVPGGETYSLTVTTAGNAVCPGVGEFTVRVSEVPRPFIRGNANLCPEGRQSTILRATTGFQTYLWENAQGTSSLEFFEVDSIGLVTLTVVDANNCPTTDSVEVTLLPEPAPEIFGDGNLCTGTLDTLTLPDQFSPTANGWDGNGNTFREIGLLSGAIEISQPGIYSVEVTDTLGCIGRNTFEVIDRPNPTPGIAGDLTFCRNENTTLSAPAGFSAYAWSTGENTETVTVDSIFTIDLMVTDSFGCQGSTSETLDTFPLPQPVISGLDYICEGGATTIVADNYPSYLWSNGDTTAAITADMPIEYAVTVTDVNGCQGSGQFSIFERENPLPSIVGDTVICPGGSTSLQSGEVYSSYEWTTGDATAETSVDQGGIIGLSVTDNFGCPGEVQREVVQLMAPVPGIIGDTAFCAGDSVQLVAEAGYQSYAWPDGSTDLRFTARTGGVISLEVIDSNGCAGTNTLQLEERPEPVFSVSGDTLFCANESGIIAAPTGFNTYNWNGGQSTRAIEIFSPGTYEVTVVDEVGCTGSATIQADTVSIPQPEILGGDYICETGTRLLFTQSYSDYQWSTGDTTAATLINRAGIYNLTVTDANGCRNTAITSIRQQRDPEPSIVGDDIFCPGESVALSTTFSYDQYTWSTGEMTASITTTYLPEVAVEVTDTFGCMGVDTIRLTSVENPTVSIAGQLDICDGEGAILQATPGFAAYNWSDGTDSVATIGRVDGIYTVTVTDQNGCTAQASQTLEVNDNPKPNIQGTPTICEGEITTLSVRNNFLDYSWSNGDTSRFTQVTESGIYIIEVESPGDCFNRDTFEVVVNIPRPSPIANAELDVCDGDTLELDAGADFLSYEWSTGSTNRSISTTTGGRFNLNVVDTNGCRTNTSVLVNFRSLPRPGITAPDVFCKGTPVTLLANGNFRTYDWSNGDSGDLIEITEGGRYELTVTDNNGCQGMVAVDLAEREAPEIEILGDLKICKGDTTVLSVPEGFPYYVWTDDTNEASIVVSEPGDYGVLVVGNNGCVGVDEVQVLFRPDPLPVITGDLEKCENADGTLDAGAGFESYSWLPDGQTTREITVDTAGIYEVRVVDDFGCENIGRAIVRDVAAPVLSIAAPPGICPGDTALLQIDSFYASINWSTGAMDPGLSVTTPGVYAVSVTNQANCLTMDSVEIAAFTNPDFNFLGDTVICVGETARIALDRSFADIQWSTSERGVTSIQVDSTADYSVRVTNADGCSTEAVRPILVNPAPPALPGPDTVLNCFDPEIQIGRPTEEYAAGISLDWQGPGIAAGETTIFQPTISVPGIYTLQTRDTLTGCLSPTVTVQVEDVQYVPAVVLSSDGEVDCVERAAFIDGSGTATGSGFQYQWLYGAQDSLVAEDVLSVSVNRAGLYTLSVLDTRTGCSNRDSIALAIDVAVPVANIAPVNILSCAVPTQTLQAIGESGSNIRYSWIATSNLQDSISGNSLVVNQPGNYILVVENLNNGCVMSDQIEVRRNDTPPAISAGPDLELDCNQPDVQLGEPFAEDRWIINWTKTNDANFQTAMTRPIVSEAGQYNLEVFDPVNGCTSYDTVEITVYEDRPQAVALTVSPERCFGDADGQIIIGNVTGGEGPYLFSWNEQTFTSSNTLTNLPAGRFPLKVQDIRGCEYDTVVFIQQGVDPLIELGPDRYINQGEFVRLTALENIDDATIQDLRWLQPDTLACATCPVQRLTPLKTTEYIATVVDDNGCRSTDSVIVYVDRTKSVYIPNAFSPNGDGYNDRVTVFASKNVKEVLTFRIFERRGNMMFQRDNFPANDLSLGWDGFHRGRLMNSQVFAYFAEVEFQDGEVIIFEGDITLVR